jgi:uncharacterized protein (DUF302 family)
MNTTNGIISLPSPYSVPETINRLAAILQEKGITIFARIDQQTEAEKVGLNLLPTQLLLFGNPQAGTPLMVAAPTIALDLPLKALAWSAADGKVWLSYNDPNYLKQRFSLSDDLVKNIAVITPLIDRALL